MHPAQISFILTFGIKNMNKKEEDLLAQLLVQLVLVGEPGAGR